jgi:hypothetical protein
MTCWAAGRPSPIPTRTEASRPSTISCSRRPGQDELNRLLENVHQLTEISEADPRLRHIHYDWLDAAERTQATVRQLSEQLRRFLDDQVWSENRRVIDILHEIESHALRLREERIPVTTELDAASPDLVLPMERPLYAPVAKAAIDSRSIQPADSAAPRMKPR